MTVLEISSGFQKAAQHGQASLRTEVGRASPQAGNSPGFIQVQGIVSSTHWLVQRISQLVGWLFRLKGIGAEGMKESRKRWAAQVLGT